MCKMPKNKKEERIPIIVDTREKQPLFLHDNKDFIVTSAALKTGDYTIDGLDKLVVIERKKSANELYANFTKYRKRFYAEIDRMQEYRFRFIVIESTWAELLDPFSYKCPMSKRKSAVGIVVSSLLNLVILHDIKIIMAGSKARTMITRLIKKIYEYYQQGKLMEK